MYQSVELLYMSATGTLDDRPAATGDAPLDVQISVRPNRTCTCAPCESDWGSVRQSFDYRSVDAPECHIAISDGETSEYRSTSAREDCPCTVFSKHHCAAELTEIREGRLIFSITLPDRSELPSIVTALRETGATVSVDRILTSSGAGEDPPVLTEKQREALTCAIESGYYERPRGATLDDLADELDITPSAVSQRLNAVNRRLIEKYCRQFDPSQLR